MCSHTALLADVVEMADVGVIQRRDGTSFSLEAGVSFGFFGKMFGEDFDGDGAVKASVARGVDFAHAPCAEAGLNFVWAEFAAGSEGHLASESIAHCAQRGRNQKPARCDISHLVSHS